MLPWTAVYTARPALVGYTLNEPPPPWLHASQVWLIHQLHFQRASS